MKATAKLYVYKTLADLPWERSEIVVKTYDSTDSGYRCSDILLDTVEAEIEFTMPSDKDILNKVVSGLKAEKAKIEADAYIKAKSIQDKIDSLLCLEYTPEVAA